MCARLSVVARAACATDSALPPMSGRANGAANRSMRSFIQQRDETDEPLSETLLLFLRWFRVRRTAPVPADWWTRGNVRQSNRSACVQRGARCQSPRERIDV